MKDVEFDRYGALVMVGALIPDLVKIGLGFELLGMDVWDFVAPFHTPVGSFLSNCRSDSAALHGSVVGLCGFRRRVCHTLRTRSAAGATLSFIERTCAKKGFFPLYEAEKGG
jgi:hypothetical protein